VSRSDIIALNHFAKFPAGDNIGDTTVFLNAADDDLFICPVVFYELGEA